MDAPEVREVSVIVQLISYYCVPSNLHEIEISSRDQVSCSQEMLHLLTDANLRVNHFLKVVWISDLNKVKLWISHISNQFASCSDK